jgi:hypothetical protein
MTTCILFKDHALLLRGLPERPEEAEQNTWSAGMLHFDPTVPGGLVSRFVTTARVLRLLVSGDSNPLDGNIEVLRSVFRTGAEACERLDETNQQLSQLLMRVTELEALLAQVVEVLEASPLPVDGGSWAVLELAQEVQRALGQSEPG